jgi:hypothetical protein
MTGLTLHHHDQVAICVALGIEPYDSSGRLVNPPTSASLIAAAAALPVRKKEFLMKPETITLIVDTAVSDGRIDAENREGWRRLFEADATEATREISRIEKDPARAQRNFLASDEGERLYQSLACTLGLREERV